MPRRASAAAPAVLSDPSQPTSWRSKAVSAGADILSLGVAELAAKIRLGEVSSVEATRAVLDALDGRGPALNAVARLYPESALAAAKAADEARARGDALGPLHGVPLAHKDMFHRAGELAEYGSTLFRGHRPVTSATVIARLDAAGAIDCGRLNMVEFALGITGHNAHTGHPRNAWDPARITGGSTSGGATSVAARLVPATLGSHTRGPLRLPPPRQRPARTPAARSASRPPCATSSASSPPTVG